jgi:hypothetical protein
MVVHFSRIGFGFQEIIGLDRFSENGLIFGNSMDLLDSVFGGCGL